MKATPAPAKVIFEVEAKEIMQSSRPCSLAELKILGSGGEGKKSCIE